MRFQQFALFGGAVLMAGCTATTSLQSKDPSVSVTLNNQPTLGLQQPVSKTYATTSFGQYKFKAEKPGGTAMYGLMPLKFNGGYLAADILFFAPAALFNLREVFPFYEFDVDAGVIRFKSKAEDAWTVYQPTAAEAANAKAYFAGLENTVKAASAEKTAAK